MYMCFTVTNTQPQAQQQQQQQQQQALMMGQFSNIRASNSMFTLDMRHMNLRIQLYIKSKAKVNIGNQCGTTQTIARYSKSYNIQRQFPMGSNIIEGEIYL